MANIVSRLEAATTKVEQDALIQRSIIQGPADGPAVTTEGGDIPTLASVLAGVEVPSDVVRYLPDVGTLTQLKALRTDPDNDPQVLDNTLIAYIDNGARTLASFILRPGQAGLNNNEPTIVVPNDYSSASNERIYFILRVLGSHWSTETERFHNVTLTGNPPVIGVEPNGYELTP